MRKNGALSPTCAPLTLSDSQHTTRPAAHMPHSTRQRDRHTLRLQSATRRALQWWSGTLRGSGAGPGCTQRRMGQRHLEQSASHSLALCCTSLCQLSPPFLVFPLPRLRSTRTTGQQPPDTPYHNKHAVDALCRPTQRVGRLSPPLSSPLSLLLFSVARPAQYGGPRFSRPPRPLPGTPPCPPGRARAAARGGGC